MKIKDNIRFYTIKETAKMLGKSTSFMYYNLEAGALPEPTKIEDVMYYSMNDIRKIQGEFNIKEVKEKEFFSTKEVGAIVGRSRQTVVNWSKYSEILASRGKKRLIPAPDKIGKGGQRYWTKESVKKIQLFASNIKFGDMAEFNRGIWGKNR